MVLQMNSRDWRNASPFGLCETRTGFDHEGGEKAVRGVKDRQSRLSFSRAN